MSYLYLISYHIWGPLVKDSPLVSTSPCIFSIPYTQLRAEYRTPPISQETQLGVAAFLAFPSICIMKTQEDRNMPLNKQHPPEERS